MVKKICLMLFCIQIAPITLFTRDAILLDTLARLAITNEALGRMLNTPPLKQPSAQELAQELYQADTQIIKIFVNVIKLLYGLFEGKLIVAGIEADVQQQFLELTQLLTIVNNKLNDIIARYSTLNEQDKLLVQLVIFYTSTVLQRLPIVRGITNYAYNVIYKTPNPYAVIWHYTNEVLVNLTLASLKEEIEDALDAINAVLAIEHQLPASPFVSAIIDYFNSEAKALAAIHSTITQKSKQEINERILVMYNGFFSKLDSLDNRSKILMAAYTGAYGYALEKLEKFSGVASGT